MPRNKSLRNTSLKQILVDTRPLWDHDGTRPDVRENFLKIIACGTLALGVEDYASETERLVVYHTANPDFVRVVGIERRDCGKRNWNPYSQTSAMLASTLRYQAFSGQSFNKTAIYSMICPQSEPRRSSAGRRTNTALACF